MTIKTSENRTFFSADRYVEHITTTPVLLPVVFKNHLYTFIVYNMAGAHAPAAHVAIYTCGGDAKNIDHTGFSLQEIMHLCSHIQVCFGVAIDFVPAFLNLIPAISCEMESVSC